MAGYVAQLHHAATAYGDRLGDTRLLPLAIALALHLLSLLAALRRSGAAILRAAFPERRGADCAPPSGRTWPASARTRSRRSAAATSCVIVMRCGASSVDAPVATLDLHAGGRGRVRRSWWWRGSGWSRQPWLWAGCHRSITLPDARAFEFSFLRATTSAAGAIALVLIAGGRQ